MNETSTLVFDIEKFAVHDGPGIRTVVFLKGCPLRCIWCHNPESQSFEQETMAGVNGGPPETVGKAMTVEDVMNQVRKDKSFYDNSGGGLTISGGEPLAHFETQPDEECAEAKLIVPPATRVTGARIFTIDEPMSFAPPPDDPNGTPRMRQTFAVHGASYAGGVVSAAIPRGTRGYYVEVFFENAAGRPYSLCSRWVERNA